jgi:hypothetical protein
MICYKDMTFCPSLDCAQDDCRRKLTLQIQKDARDFGLPIAQFTTIPDCHVDLIVTDADYPLPTQE